MIDSLLELIAAAAFAAIPILITILRFRRRRRRGAPTDGTGEARVGAGADSDLAAPNATGDTGALQASPAHFEREGTTPGATPGTASGKTAGRPAQPAKTQEAPPQSEGESWSTPERSGQRSAAQQFPATLERYPPLQRAILFQEILGPPKGLY